MEWVELVEIGFNSLAGSNTELIVQMVFAKMSLNYQNTPLQLYGRADASEKIIEIMVNSK